MMKLALCILLSLVFLSGCVPIFAQSINSGTVTGTVTDPSGAVVRGAQVLIQNRITGYQRAAVTDDAGSFRFTNIPQNNYQLTATAPGFSTATQDIDVRSSQPLAVNHSLKVATGRTSINVQASAATIVDNEPSAHLDVDRAAIVHFPTANRN